MLDQLLITAFRLVTVWGGCQGGDELTNETTNDTAKVTMQELGYLHGWNDGRRIWNGADGRLYHPGRNQPDGITDDEAWAFKEAYRDAIDDSGAGSFLNGEILDDDEEACFDNAEPTRNVHEINSRIMSGVDVEQLPGGRIFRCPTDWQAAMIAASTDGVVSMDTDTGEHFVEARY